MKTTTQPTKTEAILLPRFPEKPTAGYVAFYVASVIVFLFCVKSCLGKDFTKVEMVLSFYGVYHRDPVNQLIHFFGVPVIIGTFVIATAHLVLPNVTGGSRPVVLQGIPGIRPHYLNFGTLCIILYCLFYMYLDVVGFLLYAPFLYLYYYIAIEWVARDQWQAAASQQKQQQQLKDKPSSTTVSVVPWTGTGRVLKWSALLHVLAWYVQIHPGHRIMEGASPAVLANLGGALMAAPLFAFYEGIWFVGLRPELHERIQELVAQHTAELCSQGVPMRVCEEILSP